MDNIIQTANKRKEYYKTYWAKNKERLNAERREERKTDESILKREREWRNKNREHIRERDRQYHWKNKEKKNKHSREQYYKHQKKYRLRAREQTKKSRMEHKLIVINHYSKGKNCCELCGNIDMDVLSIDHINGGGRQHLREIKRTSLTEWLITNKLPDGYRILCMNCQFKERKRKNQFKAWNRINFDTPIGNNK